ncbi:MAG: polysaccharide deacetylase family protein [Treponema sp.]|nr:polysaccharide deacetylase family protein [Treponema sp.]
MKFGHNGALLFFAVSLCLAACGTITTVCEKTGVSPGTVIFSFDDGPNAGGTTARLLDVLSRYQITAGFALLGVNVEHSPELARRIYYEGHLIINHGYSERWAVHLSNGEFAANLDAGEKAISAALGTEPASRFYRPQGGFYHECHRKIWEGRGYLLAPGTARVHDAVLKAADKDKMVAEIVRKIEAQGGGIILLHDALNSHVRMEKHLAKNPDSGYNRSWIPEAVEEIIIALREKGYTLNGFNVAEALSASYGRALAWRRP